jgi:epoxyqueuosine reductase
MCEPYLLMVSRKKINLAHPRKKMALSSTHLIKQNALDLGFSFCGIAKAMKLEVDARRLENWLNKGFHGKMSYMENYFDERIDPRVLVPDAKSVITLLCNYFPVQEQNTEQFKISKYAYGTDYHFVIREKLNQLIAFIQKNIGAVNGRGFVDSAPVLERTWALKSGLGWIGKNGNIINKQQGSFFFIATLIVDISLDYDDPIAKDYCGSCTACIDACPTEAILPNKEINGSKCISYFTIELKDALIDEGMNFDNWLFGCDTCQDVCPWNRFSQPNKEQLFQPIPEIFDFNAKDFEELSKEQFNKIFKNSPLKRSKQEGLMRNLLYLKNNKID